MKLHSHSIFKGYFGDSFGHFGSQFLKGKKPNRSFHLAWSDLPPKTESLAIVFLDHDAIPVCGFTWIHWTVANIDPQLGELPENASVDMKLLEGVTSWNAGILPEAWYLNKDDATGFGGCAPPDTTHLYTVEVYALNTKLDLQRGFYLNELIKKMDGHVLEKAILQGLYRSKD